MSFNLKFLLFPFLFIFNFIKFIIYDLYTDIVFLKDVFKKAGRGEEVISNERKEMIKMALTTGWDEYFKKMWWFIIIMAGFFFLGYYYASQIYENKVNQILVEQCTKSVVDSINYSLFNLK